MEGSRVVAIIGAASGIGAACVTHFAREGWDVVLSYFQGSEETAARELAQQVNDAGQGALLVQADVTRDEDCRRLADLTQQRFARLDALICSAGTTRIVPHADLDALTPDDFLKTAAVNTVGPFQIARACAPALSAREGGAIVIVSSYGAMLGTGSSIAYAASKGATNTLTMSLARVLAPRVRVNAVCPALIAEGFLQRLNPQLFDARAAAQMQKAPLQKVGRPEDVAGDIYWLAAGTTLITGSVIMLDCGLHLNADA